MARLSRRFSRYFTLSLSRRRSRSTATPTSSSNHKLCKSSISKPIVPDDEDTHPLTASPNSNFNSTSYNHSPSSSVFTISDADLRHMEEQKLASRIDNAIDDIIAQYQYASTSTPTPTQKDVEIRFQVPHATSPSPVPSSAYSPSSYSPSNYSPPSSPPVLSARLERFRDTPPQAPGWERVDFGRRTRLFGPDSGGGRGEVVARQRKDWRGEFGRRGYAVL